MVNKAVLTAVLTATTTAALAQNAAVSSGADTGNELQEVVVTGTLIRGVAPNGSPVEVVSNAQIVATGSTNTADLLATVPSMTSFNTTPIGGNQEFRSGGQTIPGMRGLPGTAVLVMIDGHRLVGDSPLLTTADPSSIPPEAIDHVEVVQDGGSATYGSDAVAGVINIILKKNFNGAESYGSYTGANDYNAMSFGQLFGKTWSGGSALLDFHYENNSPLNNTDRTFYNEDLRQYGGVDSYSNTCGPALNLRVGSTYYNAVTGVPEAGLNVTQAATCDPRLDTQLIYPNRRYALVGDVRQDIGDKLHLSLDAKYTDDKSSGLYAPTTLQISNAGYTGIPQGLVIPGPNLAADAAVFGAGVITAANPYYIQPPNVPCVGGAGTATCQVGAPETVYANSGVFGAAGTVTNQFRAQSAMFDLGATYDLTKTWEISTDFDFGLSSSTALDPTSSGVNPAALYSAEIGTTTSTALDPFGPMTNPNVAGAIMDWPLLFKAIQRIYDFNVKADGSVVTLPGGDVKLAVGGALRDEQYAGEDPIGVPGATAPVSGVPSFTAGNYQSHSRQVHAIDGELSLPIVGAGNALPGIQKLSLSVAGRYDHYSDFGSTSNPKYGITWSPIRDVALRATYGTSFHAPQLADIYAIDTRVGVTQVQYGANPASYPGNIAALVAAGNAGPAANFPNIYTIGMPGGKPGLLPETAKTGTFGVDFTPSFLPGFRANITNFLIRYFNEVEIPTTPGTAASTNFCNPSYIELYTFNGINQCASNPTLAGVPATPLSSAQLNAVLTGLRFYAPFTLAQVESLGLPVYFVSSAQRQNIGTTDIDGWDFDFNYVHQMPFGLLATDLSGEYLYKFQSQTAPGAVFVDNLKSGSQYFQNDAGAQDIIPWHFRYTLGLMNGPISQQAAVNYTGHYNYLYSQYNYVASPTGKTTPAIQWVQEFITIDYSLNYAFPQDSGFLKGLKAQFNVYNVLNQQPPLVYITGTSPSSGFNSASASPLGRTFRFSLDKRW
jgi:iron complex outermembrane receptor protein